MRNYEVFNTEQELLDRIQQLQETGYQYSEFEVYTSNELSEDSEYYYDVNKHDGEASFVDKVAAFFTGEDPEERVFSKYEWDEASKEQAKRAIDNGLYVLVVDREGYYENEENFRYLDNPENRENDYINNPEYTGDGYVNNPEYNRDDVIADKEIGNESPTKKNRRELTDEDELSVENYTLYSEDDEELDYDEEDDDLL